MLGRGKAGSSVTDLGERYLSLTSHLSPYSATLNLLMAQVIIVGGGLAGLSAAHTLLERGANVLLLDKQGYVSFSLFFISITSCP